MLFDPEIRLAHGADALRSCERHREKGVLQDCCGHAKPLLACPHARWYRLSDCETLGKFVNHAYAIRSPPVPAASDILHCRHSLQLAKDAAEVDGRGESGLVRDFLNGWKRLSRQELLCGFNSGAEQKINDALPKGLLETAA